jgi:hypothetical protein
MENLNKPFLKWWIQFVCISFGVVLAFELGWWHALYQSDITKISLAILAIFCLTTLLTGYISKNFQKQKIKRLGNYAWFSSEAMITLGMIGTVAGFLIMLGGAFSSINVNDVVSVQNAISKMAVGMSTALSTTLVGLICSVLTKVQMVILENSWEDGGEK